MSGFMNEHDIDTIVMLTMRHKSPLEPYARYLRNWAYIVNCHSDGWHSWPGGHRAASKLCDLLDRYGAIQNGYSIARNWVMPTPEECRRAMTPIKSCATRHGFPPPEFKGCEL